MRNLSFLIVIVSLAACSEAVRTEQLPSPTQTPAIIATRFAYPVGSGKVTQAKDRDPWYNAQDFGKNDHLGEDWNLNTGGDSDCGQPVIAAADGTVTYAKDAGPGWGNVVIIEHSLSDGKKVQTLYGHLATILRTEGVVKIGEKIGTVGNAGGRYLCHLHFELRTSDCPMWNQEGPGYSRDRKGWVDPSDFIDSHL